MSVWKRRGLRYLAEIKHNPPIYKDGFYITLTIRSYGFFTFHLLKWIHGNEEMERLGK